MADLPTVPDLTIDRAQELATIGDRMFLKRLALAQGLSPTVQKRKAQPGEFTIGKHDDAEFRNLGSSVRLVVGPMRAHALVMEDNEVVSESFDMDAADFKKIQAEAMGKKKPPGRSAMFGTDFLFYAPDVLAVPGKPEAGGIFVTLSFMKTARREARPLFALSGQLVEIYAKEIVGRRFTWFVPAVRTVSGDVPVADGKLHDQALLAFRTGAAGGTDEEGEESEESAPEAGRRPR